MTRIALVAALAAFSLPALTGCATMIGMGGGGTLFQSTTTPLPYASYYGETASAAMKTGSASFTSILGLICTGDAGLRAAMENGGIKKIHHIDQQVTNFLGLIATYKVTVYGE